MGHNEYIDRVLNESQDTQLNKFVHNAYVNVNKDWIDPKRLAPDTYKIWRQIHEEYDKIVKIHGHPVTIFKNPDRGELSGCIDIGGNVRGVILTDTNDLYVWSLGDDYVIEHGAMITELKLNNRPFIPIMLDTNQETVLISNYYYAKSPLFNKIENEELRRMVNDNPAIKNIDYIHTSFLKK